MSEPTKILFVDRDGTMILETADEQIDSFAKLKQFYPGAHGYPELQKSWTTSWLW